MQDSKISLALIRMDTFTPPLNDFLRFINYLFLRFSNEKDKLIIEFPDVGMGVNIGPIKKIDVFQVPCQKKTGSVGRLYFFFFLLFFFVANSTKQFLVLFPLLLKKNTDNVIRLWILVICTMADLL